MLLALQVRLSRAHHLQRVSCGMASAPYKDSCVLFLIQSGAPPHHADRFAQRPTILMTLWAAFGARALPVLPVTLATRSWPFCLLIQVAALG